MKHTLSTQVIHTLSLGIILSLAVIPFLASSSYGQDADVIDAEPSRITQSLISRSELKRLLNQPPQNSNPLRRRPAPTAAPIPNPAPVLTPAPRRNPTFQDSSVRPTAWQQEEAPQVSPEGFVVNRLPPKKPEVKPTAVVEPPATATAPPTTFATPPADVGLPAPTNDISAQYGPVASPDLESYWGELDMLLEVSVEGLEQEIAERQSTIEASFGADEDTKNKKLQSLDVAKEASLAASQNVAKKAEFQNLITNLAADLERLRQQAKNQAEPPPVDNNLSVDEMQTRLRNAEAELLHNKSAVAQNHNEIKKRDDRLASIPEERLQKREAVNQFHEEFMQKQAAGTEDVISLLTIRAKELKATTHVQMLEHEANWYDLSQEKLPLEKAFHQRRVQILELEIKSLNTAIATRRQNELNRQIQLARRNAVVAQPALRDFSEQTTALTLARAELAKKSSALQDEKLKVSTQDDVVKKQLSELKTSIGDIEEEGSSSLLIEVHRNLIQPFEGMARIQDIESELRLTRGQIRKLRNEEELFLDPQTYIHDTLDILHDVKVADTTLLTLAHEAIETHRHQLSALEKDSEDYQKLLNSVLTSRKILLKDITDTRELVNAHALWVQSSDPVGIDVLQKSYEGANEFFDPSEWQDLGNSIAGRMKRRPYESALGMCGFLVAFVVGRRFKG